MDRKGSETNLPIRQPISIHAIVNFDGDRHGHGNGNGMCKQALTKYLLHLKPDLVWTSELFDSPEHDGTDCDLCGGRVVCPADGPGVFHASLPPVGRVQTPGRGPGAAPSRRPAALPAQSTRAQRLQMRSDYLAVCEAYDASCKYTRRVISEMKLYL